MQAKDVYDKIGGSYDEAISQIRKEERFAKYFAMFTRDGSFSELKNAMESGDMTGAFAAAHTLKGITKNLAFTKLADLVSGITEDLRDSRDTEHAKAVFPELEQCYEDTIKAVLEFVDGI